MNKKYIPTYKYNIVRKGEPKFSSVQTVLDEENAKWSTFNSRTIKVYNEDYSSVTTIVTTNEIEYNKTISYVPRLKIHNKDEIQIREKGYHRFVDITLQAKPINSDQIYISTLEDDISQLRNSGDHFQEVKNIGQLMCRLKCEEIISKVAFDICSEFQIESHELRILKIVCHEIDTLPIYIYDAVIRIYARILEIDSIVIKNKIEEKLRSYEYLLSEIEPIKIELFKSNGKDESDGMRLVHYNRELNSNSILQKSIAVNSSTGNEIKNLLIETKKSNIAAPCIPIYRDALVFRDLEEQIVGHFNICFECSKIESHNLTQMPITTELMTKLSAILNPADNRR